MACGCGTATGQGKKTSGKSVALVLSLSASWVQAGPSGGQIVSGAGSISQSGEVTTIQQTSRHLSLNWKAFDIAPQETVNFEQPSASAITVNRIYDTNGTKILGQLNANGQLYLINPNGILFGQGARVDVGGLVASTLDLNDASLGSNTQRFSGNGNGSIINQGNLQAADGGYVALLGNSVSNQGVISAKLGTVALAAGSAATLTFDGSSMVNIQVDQSTLDNLAENKQLIQADGGRILMTAGAKDTLLASVVNNTGIIEAHTVENRDGVITLLGGMQAGTVNVGGTLDAGAPDGGNGGFIETSAAQVKVADDAQVSTLAPQGDNGSWLIDPTDFTIAAADGDMTGTAVSAALAGGNVSIQSTAGATDVNGDINVNDNVSWSANTLTLNAQHNIVINSEMNGSGTAGLVLEYGQAAENFGNTAEYLINAPVNLADTGSFSTKLGSNGEKVDYTIITNLGAEGSTSATDLQGINGGLEENYVLGADIDAANTLSWNDGAGFAPIGSRDNPFTGIFDGLGHTISGLAINRPTTNDVGLFGAIESFASIANVGLVGSNISGNDYVGGLVGINKVSEFFWFSDGGSVRESFATGTVSGNDYVGGLVGANGGVVSNSFATNSVTGNNHIGGLIGVNDGEGLLALTNKGTVNNSYASGKVNGNSIVGGLAGSNDGKISNSHASGSVTGQDSVGGLVGINQGSDYDGGSVSESYATGNVSGRSHIGGLVGDNQNQVIDSYATGNVSASQDNAGGLAGFNYRSSSISSSYALGSVNGRRNVGGLAGGNSGGIGNSYATGSVDGSSNIGGLTGGSDGTISNSYATGSVSGQEYVGGLVGLNDDDGGAWSSNGGEIINSYATGSVNGQDYIGGLVGGNDGTADGSYASGSVSGHDYVGGLVGGNDGTISNSYAIGSVHGVNNVGGLVGRGRGDSVSINEPIDYDSVDWLPEEILLIIAPSDIILSTLSPFNSSFSSFALTTPSSIYIRSDPNNLVARDFAGGLSGGDDVGIVSNSYATGAVSGSRIVGGLAGALNGGSVSNSYSTGNVNAQDIAGGLVGYSEYSLISDSYAAGRVNGQNDVGGLVGYNVFSSTDHNVFWDIESSGQTSSAIGIGKTTAEMQALSTFKDAGWDIDDVGGSGKVWRSYDGNSYPLLRSFLSPLSVTLTPLYDGSEMAMTNIAALASQEVANMLGSLRGTELTLSSTTADSYTVSAKAGGLYSTQQGYDLIATAVRTISTPGTVAGELRLPNSISWDSGKLVIDSSGEISNIGVINGGVNSAFELRNGTWRQIGANLPDFTVNDFHLSGGTFLRTLSGDGSSGNPYLLTDIYGVQGMARQLSANYALNNDIDAAGTSNWNRGAGFAPIGSDVNPFTGTFDGSRHTLANLTINRPTTDFVGLFGFTSSPIANVGLSGLTVSGNHYVGGLIGASGGEVGNSFAEGSVSGAIGVGGLIGFNNGTVNNSYATGSVSGDWFVGGLVGGNDRGTIVNSYAMNTVSGYEFVGGLTGGSSGTVKNSFWNSEISSQTSSPAQKLVAAQLASVLSPEPQHADRPVEQANPKLNGLYASRIAGQSSQLLTIEGGGVNLPE